MSAPKTKKSKFCPYFDHTDCDKTFSKAVCKFCDYSTHYCKHTSILCNHLPQNKHEIIQFEADSKDSNPSVSSHNHIEKTTADNKQITHYKDEMNSSSSNSNSSSHNREQGILIGDNKQSSLSQAIPKDAYILSMQNNQRLLKFMKLFDERYTSLDIDDLRRNYFLGKTLTSARFIHLTIDINTNYDQQLHWFVINSYSCIKNKVWHDVLFIAPCQVENSFEHVCCCVLEIAKIYNITHKIKTVVLDDENCMSYFAKGEEASIKNWKIFFHFKHTLMNIVNSAIHNSGTILSSIVTMKKLLYDIVNQENSKTIPIDERMNKDLDMLYLYLHKVSEFLRIFEPSRKIDLLLEATNILGDVNKAQGKIHMISEVLPNLFKICIDLATRYNSLRDATLLLCTKLRAKLGDFLNNWKDIGIYATATLLDPRFRTTKFVINPDEWIEKILCQLTENLKTINLKKRSITLDNTKTALVDEFQRYIKEKPIETDSDPISWWDREGCQLFPLLSSFAFEYLSIPIVPTSTSKQVLEQIWKIVQ